MSVQRVMVIGFCSFCVAAGGFAGTVPVTVSPGDASRLARIGATCPTFSWGGVEAASSYELVVYRLGEDVEQSTAVLRQTLTGSVGSWTPSLDRCLERGGQYAWSVRALTPDGGRTSWSEASLFEISPELSIREVERALRVLRRYVAAKDEVAEEAGRGPAAPRPSGPVALRRSRQPSSPRGSAPKALSGPGSSTSLHAPDLAVPTVSASDYALSIDSDFDLGRFVFKDGVPFLHDYDGASSDGRNTALGASALQSVTPGSPQPWSGLYNTAFGYQALRDDSEGSFNTAVGHNALIGTSTGANNTGVGHAALSANEAGSENTAVGYDAATLTTGSFNTALGSGALSQNASGSRNTALGSYAARGDDLGPVTGSDNIAVGHASLYFSTSGSFNTAVGVWALQNNDTGNDNTAVGYRANNWGTEGTANTAVGTDALRRNTASSNTAVGYQAMSGLDQEDPLVPTTGGQNTAVGFRALEQVTTGSQNTAVGQQTLQENLAGSHNVALGDQAGLNITGSSNIMINHPGFAGEDNRLRIGSCEFDTDPGADNTRCLKQVNIKGIYDKTLPGTAQHAVYINEDGQLGKQSSSRRYKREIHPIGGRSKRLLDLRPVSFRFKGTAGDQPVHFGLIAEEVEQAFPELVGRDAHGRADSVRYELLTSLLVNELQRQEREIGMLRRRQSSQRAQLLGLLLVGGTALLVGRVGRG